MEEKLIARLADLGYSYDATSDAGLLLFCQESVENDIKNRINTKSIPDGLEQIYIDMVCGNFLRTKKSCGQLSSFDFEASVQSIKEGDTQVTFIDGLSPEQQFDALIIRMTTGHDEDIIRYRRIVW